MFFIAKTISPSSQQPSLYCVQKISQIVLDAPPTADWLRCRSFIESRMLRKFGKWFRVQSSKVAELGLWCELILSWSEFKKIMYVACTVATTIFSVWLSSGGDTSICVTLPRRCGICVWFLCVGYWELCAIKCICMHLFYTCIELPGFTGMHWMHSKAMQWASSDCSRCIESIVKQCSGPAVSGLKAEQKFTATSGLRVRVRVCVCSVSW